MYDSSWRLLLDLNDFDHYHARQRYRIFGYEEIIQALAPIRNRSRFIILETNEEYEYTFWDGQSWYDEFKDRKDFEDDDDG
ncbi:MAG: hypothetical protein OXG23_13815 [Chloroflexi bacterium]|nr:hypothetical protein [Chloroflexota bacterium]